MISVSPPDLTSPQDPKETPDPIGNPGRGRPGTNSPVKSPPTAPPVTEPPSDPDSVDDHPPITDFPGRQPDVVRDPEAPPMQR
jgi:hypothetical protein